MRQPHKRGAERQEEEHAHQTYALKFPVQPLPGKRSGEIGSTWNLHSRIMTLIIPQDQSPIWGVSHANH